MTWRGVAPKLIPILHSRLKISVPPGRQREASILDDERFTFPARVLAHLLFYVKRAEARIRTGRRPLRDAQAQARAL